MNHQPSQPGENASLDLALESPVPFVDRRNTGVQRRAAGIERRQFTNSYDDLSPAAAEIGRAIDEYKLAHHRRFVTYEELLTIIVQLGYQRTTG
jgi:hypothetical protein